MKKSGSGSCIAGGSNPLLDDDTTTGAPSAGEGGIAFGLGRGLGRGRVDMLRKVGGDRLKEVGQNNNQVTKPSPILILTTQPKPSNI